VVFLSDVIMVTYKNALIARKRPYHEQVIEELL